MDFIDKTVLKLSEDASRLALFDDAALEQILSAGYDTSVTPVNAPFSAEFDEFTLGFADFLLSPLEGQVYLNGAQEPGRIALQFSDIQGANSLKAEALWRGSIIARSAPEDSVITSADFSWPAMGEIDSAIIAADGSLPTNITVLEQKRRAALVTHMKGLLQDPQVFSEHYLDELLSDLGVSGVSELIDRPTGIPGAVRIGFSAPSGAPPTPQRFPVVAAILVRDVGFSVRDLLFESKLLRQRMDRAGVEKPRSKSLPLRRGILVIWILPEAVFGDAGWPGATASMSAAQAIAARRSRAGQWLAKEGIGLVSVS